MGCLVVQFTRVCGNMSVGLERIGGVSVTMELVDWTSVATVPAGGISVTVGRIGGGSVSAERIGGISASASRIGKGMSACFGLVCGTNLGDTEVLWVQDGPLVTIDNGYLITE